MATRLELQLLLESLLKAKHVYYQPPSSVKMVYPAIVYSRNNIKNSYADDINYAQRKSYSITVIDKNPDSAIVDAVSLIPQCRFDRHYTSDNLNHDVFTLYY